MAIQVIANRHAGRGLAALEAAIGRRAGEVELITTANPSEAKEAIQSARHQAERLVFAGGDGTFHLASTVLGDAQTPDLVVGFVPTGTGSDFMRSFPGPQSLDERLDVALFGAPRPFRPGLATGTGESRPFTNVASIGVSAAVVHAVEGGLKRFGAFGYTLAMVQGILTYRSTEMEVFVDGEPLFAGRGYLTAIGCGRYFGGGKMITPQAQPLGDHLHVITVADEGTLKTLMATRKLESGTHIDLPIVHHRIGQRVQVRGDGLRSELDGELGPSGALTITRGGVAFRLAVPEA